MNTLRNLVFLCLIFCVCGGNPLCGQTDPELLQRAKAAGITPEQIEALLYNTPPAPAKTGGFAEKISRERSTNAPVRTLSDTLFQHPKSTIFGQNIFLNPNLTFTPAYNTPTPKGYILGAGDEVIVDVWGASEMSVRGKITPEGTLFLPGAGPVQLNGYTIEQAGQKIRTKLRASMENIGADTHVKVALGEIRSIRVHILGEARMPGSYTLPALATVFNALYLAAGVNDIGSLRRIRVIRNNEEIHTLDLYQTLIYGRTETNVRLEEGDILLIPTYENRVHISGAVKREMNYELREEESLGDLLAYAGGFRGEAYRENLHVRRKAGRQYEVHTVEQDRFDTFRLQDGDSVAVGEIVDLYTNRLTIRGAVMRPGEYQYGPQLNRLSQLLAKAENLKGNQFADRGQIIRMRSDFTTEILPFELRAIASGSADIELQPEDEVYIPSIEEMTERRYVLVRGEVNRPDTLAFHHNMTLDDAVMLAGGVKESASGTQVEVARRIKDPRATGYTGEVARTFSLSLPGSDFVLEPFDEIHIRRSPAYFEQQGVSVSGEILFEGNYALSHVGERLSGIIGKAGGATPEAYVKGASLIRTLTLDEKAKLEAKLAMAATRLGRDSLDLNALDIANTYSVGIDLEKALRNPGSHDDIVLRDGDAIRIPRQDNTVKISGSVLYANTVTYDGGRLTDYIAQGGGYKDGARKRPFIVYMNGKIASTRRGFLHKRYPPVEPGCEIIVPEKADRKSPLGVGEMLNIASSSTAIAAMITTLLR